MKKMYYLFFLLFLFVSCGETIDKKIVVSEYSSAIQEIKTKHTEYTEADFQKAGKLMDAMVIQSFGNQEIDKTYRQLLDEAQKAVQKEEEEKNAYLNKMEEIRSKFSIKVLKGEYVKRIDKFGVDERFIAEIEVANNAGKPIVEYTGNINVKNESGELLKSCYISHRDTLTTGESRTTEEKFPIMASDKKFLLKDIPAEQLTYEWMPKTIKFEDGSMLEAPQKPYSLLKEDF